MHVEPWQGKLNITFLAVDDEVAFLVACRDGIRYAVAVRVFGQNGGDQGVGAGVLGDKRAVPAREFERERESHMDRQRQSEKQNHFTPCKTSKGGLIGLIVAAFYPPSTLPLPVILI